MELKRIDAHAHVNFNVYKDDAEEVIRRANDDGTGMLVVGSQYSTSERAVDYAESHEAMWAVVGLHPSHLFSLHVDEAEVAYETREETFDPDAYRALVARSKKVVAIGECGLDFYRMPDGLDRTVARERQEAGFRAQLDLAHELGLPVMIHCRDAHRELATILEEFHAAKKPIRGNIHCFTGTLADAERYLAIGFYVSFTGIVTFPPKSADKGKETLADVARHVPLDRLLIETDAPYLAPLPHRGKRNEPSYVRHVSEFIAALKNLSPEELDAATLANTKKLFSLDF